MTALVDAHTTSAEGAFRAAFEGDFDYVCTSLIGSGRAAPTSRTSRTTSSSCSPEKLPSLDTSRPLRPWLFGAAMRLLHAHWRRSRRATEVHTSSPDALDSAPSPVEITLAMERRRLVDAALDDLPDEQRAVFVLHAIDDVPMPEVARALEIPVNTAYSRFRLAKEAFSKSLRRARLGGLP